MCQPLSSYFSCMNNFNSQNNPLGYYGTHKIDTITIPILKEISPCGHSGEGEDRLKEYIDVYVNCHVQHR